MHIEVINQMDADQNPLPRLDRASLFGDGFFTTGIIQDSQFCHQQRHFERLLISANRLLFTGLDLSQLQCTLNQLVSQIESGAIRISIARQQQQRGYAIAGDAKTICTIVLSELPDLPSDYCQLIDAKTAISCNPTLAGIKHINRLDSVLAASEITSIDQEALMYHGDLAISGSKSNLFVRLNGIWLTPKLFNCGIAGITRDRTIEMFNQQNIQYNISDIHRSDLIDVDAAFVTNSLIGVWPVKSINGRITNPENSIHIRKLVTRV
jgi:4-amino-4-deoxychorismate lyase